MAYALPALPYSFDALEPHIDARTMEIHYGKHHQAYCDNANKFLSGTLLDGEPIEEVLKRLDEIPQEKRTAVRNHGGGYANHNMFWTMLGPKSSAPSGDLANALKQSFGSVDAFREKFEAAALGQFGSGWAWLVRNGDKLEVMNLPNQDSPLSIGKTPLLCLDVWEHAYYLKYQNRRPEYIAAWWQVVDWEEVAKRFANAG
jgi:Fe-Mn family superoxide dismutase